LLGGIANSAVASIRRADQSGVLATVDLVALVNGASVFIITIYGSGDTSSSSFGTRGSIASISASEGNGGKNTSSGIVARISCADLTVIANLGSNGASSGRIASSNVTKVGWAA